MEVSSEQLKATYREYSDDELIELMHEKALTDVAYNVACEEMLSRGLQPPPKIDPTVTEVRSHPETEQLKRTASKKFELFIFLLVASVLGIGTAKHNDLHDVAVDIYNHVFHKADDLLNTAIDDGERGNYKDSLSALEKARTIAPHDYRVYMLRGITYGRMGKTDQMTKSTKKAIAIADRQSDKTPELRSEMAIMYALLGDVTHARRMAKSALVGFQKAHNSASAHRMRVLLDRLSPAGHG